MSNKNKHGFDDFVVGLIRVQKYFDNGEGEIMKLEILMPKCLKSKGHLRSLLLKDYRTAIISSSKNDDKYLKMTLTNINIVDDEEVPE